MLVRCAVSGYAGKLGICGGEWWSGVSVGTVSIDAAVTDGGVCGACW